MFWLRWGQISPTETSDVLAACGSIEVLRLRQWLNIACASCKAHASLSIAQITAALHYVLDGTSHDTLIKMLHSLIVLVKICICALAAQLQTLERWAYHTLEITVM